MSPWRCGIIHVGCRWALALRRVAMRNRPGLLFDRVNICQMGHILDMLDIGLCLTDLAG